MADLSAADVLALKDNDNEGFLEGNGIIILILFFLMFGGFGGGWGANNSAVQGALTRADMFEGFNNQDVNGQLRGITNGICEGFYGLNTTALQGFNSIGSQIADGRYATQSCCCETNRNIDAVRYENAQNTCSIITAANANTQKILDKMCETEVNSLRTDLQSAQLALSNAAQTTSIINAVRPYPVMSVPFAAYGCTGYGCNC
jgi:hypothetical protein